MKSNTIDPRELSHFQSLSPQWWDEKGPFEILHKITPLRVAFIKEKAGVHFKRNDAVTRPLTGLRVLDIGCGGGLLCEPLARLGAEVTGIDPLEENIRIAKDHAQAMGLSITYASHTIEELPKKYSPFDVIIASEVIEHVYHPESFLKASASHLDKRGAVVVTTFNKTLKSYLLGILMAEHVLKWAPRGTHSWEKFISPEDLSSQLSSLGLVNQELTGLCYSPLRGWYLSPSTDVNYFFWAARN